MSKKNNDMSINGSGSSGGGKFDKVEINGNGKLHGDVECEEFKCSGNGKINGNLMAEKVRIDGNCKFNGKLSGEEIVVNGTAKANGHTKVENLDVNGRFVVCDDMQAKNVNVEGECRTFGSVEASNVKVNGFLSVGKGCECETFEGNGKFKISGLLSAEKIDIKLFWDSRVKEIGGHTVVIERLDKFVAKVISKFIKVRFHVETIEADDINISYTKAKVVRGKNVILGDGCEVDLVEYTETFLPGANAKFGRAERV